MILEFKVQDEEEEETLKDTADAVLRQIQEKKYAAGLISRGVAPEQIRRYGFAFHGKIYAENFDIFAYFMSKNI